MICIWLINVCHILTDDYIVLVACGAHYPLSENLTHDIIVDRLIVVLSMVWLIAGAWYIWLIAGAWYIWLIIGTWKIWLIIGTW